SSPNRKRGDDINRENRLPLRGACGWQRDALHCRCSLPPRSHLMGLITRLSDLVAVNLDALLDRIEGPERLLERLLHETEQGLAVARQHAAAAIAAEHLVGRELEQWRARAAQWGEGGSRGHATGREGPRLPAL